MTKLLIILTLAIFWCSCAIIRPAFTPIALTETLNVIGTQNELYVKANLWLADICYPANVKYKLQFSDKQAGIQFSDRQAGIVKGNHVLYYSLPSQWNLEKTATITLTAIDNQITIRINCNDKPQGFGIYPQSRMTADLNDIIKKFKSEFKNN